MAMTDSVAVIIVNWNGLEHLLISLPDLHKQTYKSLTVYVVDNASSDQSVATVREQFPWVKVIVLKQNQGFAGGNNVGIEQALADGHDYIMLLNNDTTFGTSVIGDLVEYMKSHPKVGIAQPKLLLMDHRDTLDSCGSYLSKAGFLLHVGVEEKDGPKYSKAMPMFTIKGAAMMIRRAVLDQVGAFDDDFFAYFEETDLCWRAWLAGWQVYYAPVTTVYHKMGGSTAKIGSPTINFHSNKNRLMSLTKNLAWYNAIWMVPLHVLLVIGFSFFYFAALRGKSGLSIYKGIGWNITHFAAIMKKRRAIQKSRVMSDKELFAFAVKPIQWRESFAFMFRLVLGVRKTPSTKS